ncbi:MAG: glycoside hydrolase domain-containing protein [Bacteroidales bacterium]
MNFRNSIAALLFATSSCLYAQTHGVTQCGTPTGTTPFPVISYEELANPVKADLQAWNKMKGKISQGWGSIDQRYNKETPYSGLISKIQLTAWKGERVNAQYVISSPVNIDEVSYSISDFKHKSDPSASIGKDRIHSGFVRYVMTDEANSDGETACGARSDHSKFDSSLVADPIDHHLKSINIAPNSSRALWVRVWVPEDAKSGRYEAVLTVNGKKESISIDVKNRVLPQPADWKFHLDLWQNPFSVARYYNVDLWSKEHFEAMKPYTQMMRESGIKVITASIMHKPWNGQTEDAYETMITWIKKADGSWAFDYTVFDMWVEFMLSEGISKQINCYSMIPWRLSFQYMDQATNTFKFMNTKPGEKEYNEMWGAMLASFSKHLREKGWFDKTCISIDERPMKQVLEAIKLIESTDKEFKISFAGAYHEEFATRVNDYSLAQRTRYPEKIKKERAEKGFTTTYYTCCAEAYPNNFTFSPPAESAWLPIHAATENLDGYLRWDFNHWVKEPLFDSRFRTWAAGDTYVVYPGGRTSIRYERLVEGIQAYEKVRVLRDEWAAKGDKSKAAKLNALLKDFTEQNVKAKGAAVYVNKLNNYLNTL